MMRGVLRVMFLTAILFFGLAYGQERAAPEQGGPEKRSDAKLKASSQCFIEIQSKRDPAIRLRIYGPYTSRRSRDEATSRECSFPPWECYRHMGCPHDESGRPVPDRPTPGPERPEPNLKLGQEWGEIYVGPRARLKVFQREGGPGEAIYGKRNSVLKLEPRTLEEMDTLQILCD